MSRILIYGDSNTWGSGAYGGRYESVEQWPNLLERLLGDTYQVVQEGVCGRIAGAHISNPSNMYKNGKSSFEVAEHAACPFDVLVIALGTNDIKDKYELSAEQIVEDLLWYKEEAEKFAKRDEDMPKLKAVIYVGIANFRLTGYVQLDSDKAKAVNDLLQQTNLPAVIPDNLEHSTDGLHYSKGDHKKVAKLVHDKIRELEL